MGRFEAGLWKALRSNTFFPTPDVIEKACETIRASLVNPRAAIDEINAMVAHKAAHPELYETSEEEREMAKKINERFGMERPKVIDTTPVMMSCPHCSQELPVAPNIRFWTVEELRGYADVLESNQAIAAANREAEKATRSQQIVNALDSVACENAGLVR